jgi:peptidoglycan hydrolase CwlO-like protein
MTKPKSMPLLALTIIAVVALIISALCLVLVLIILIRHKAQVTMLGSQYQAQELIFNNLQRVNDQLHVDIGKLHRQDEQIMTESVQISKQLEHRIKKLQTQIDNQDDVISQLQTDKGDDKFYTRAIKLAKKGADIDEIATECELPYAEAEMLISVYQNKTPS